jgi:hypothetical protein
MQSKTNYLTAMLIRPRQLHMPSSIKRINESPFSFSMASASLALEFLLKYDKRTL